MGRELSGQTVTNPRRAVENAALLALLEAYSDPYKPFSLFQDGNGDVMFVCPRCHVHNWNGGTAVVLPDGWRWICHRCRHRGTRAVFERIILEDADLLERFLEYIEGGNG